MPAFCAVLKLLGWLIQARVEMNVGKHVQLRISDDFAVGEVYPKKKREVPLVLAEVPMVEICHRLAYQALNWASACWVWMMVRFFCCQPMREEPYQEITVEGSVCVCECIHHNIVCPRASSSHTPTVEIALTIAYTVTQSCLCTTHAQARLTHTHFPQRLLVYASDTCRAMLLPSQTAAAHLLASKPSENLSFTQTHTKLAFR